MIYTDFPLDLTGFSPGKHLIQYLVLKMHDVRNFVLHNWILSLDSETDYLKLQVAQVKNTDVTANPKPQTLEINRTFENPEP